MIDALQYLVFGLLVGGYGTMVGLGGGFLIVPYLLLVRHVSPEQAAGTSITVVFLNALSGTIAYVKQDRIDYKAGLKFAAATIPGAIAGAFFSARFSGRLFDVVFATSLALIAVYLLWRPISNKSNRPEGEPHVYNLRLGILLSVFVGFMSSILGIGGGIIHVPGLIHLLGFPAHIAVATSHFILAITAFIGAGTHMSLGHVLIRPALLMGIGVVVGAQFGARFGQNVKGPMLVRMLSVALFVVALRLFLR